MQVGTRPYLYSKAWITRLDQVVEKREEDLSMKEGATSRYGRLGPVAATIIGIVLL